MQYVAAVPQEKSNSLSEVVIYPWVNVSGYHFDVMNTSYESAASLV